MPNTAAAAPTPPHKYYHNLLHLLPAVHHSQQVKTHLTTSPNIGHVRYPTTTLLSPELQIPSALRKRHYGRSRSSFTSTVAVAHHRSLCHSGKRPQLSVICISEWWRQKPTLPDIWFKSVKTSFSSFHKNTLFIESVHLYSTYSVPRPQRYSELEIPAFGGSVRSVNTTSSKLYC